MIADYSVLKSGVRPMSAIATSAG